MSEQKRIENRIRVSEDFKKFVLAHCGDADSGEWLEKQLKSSLRKDEKHEDYEKTIAKLEERLKGQQSQPSTNTQVVPFQDLTPSVLTATEIIVPNVQTVKIGGREIRVSNTQKEKGVWKDGHWIYSAIAAGHLAFLDAMGELGQHHAKELNKIKTDGLRERETIRMGRFQTRENIRNGNFQDVDAQETSHKKYDPNALRHWCPQGKGAVYPSQCEICEFDCEYSPKTNPTRA